MARHIKFFFTPILPAYEPWKLKLMHEWKTILGDLHEHAILINIHNNILTIGVYDSTWLQELYILSCVLLQTINSYLGGEHITSLRFKTVGREQARYTKAPAITVRQHERRSYTLCPQEQRALTAIRDTELRTALEGYLNRCKEP